MCHSVHILTLEIVWSIKHQNLNQHYGEKCLLFSCKLYFEVMTTILKLTTEERQQLMKAASASYIPEHIKSWGTYLNPWKAKDGGWSMGFLGYLSFSEPFGVFHAKVEPFSGGLFIFSPRNSLPVLIFVRDIFWPIFSVNHTNARWWAHHAGNASLK